jgi:hypothetical protein
MSMISNMFLKKKQDKNNTIKSNLIELQTGHKCTNEVYDIVERTLKLMREDNSPLSTHYNVLNYHSLHHIKYCHHHKNLKRMIHGQYIYLYAFYKIYTRHKF